MAVRKLTERQQRFVELFAASGNASEAALQAGFSDGSIGRRLVTKSHVAAAIAAFGRKRRRRAIASLDERHELLTLIARDRKAKHADRIRATEVLMRAHGEFATIAVVTPPGSGAAAAGGDDEDAPMVTFYMPSNGRDQNR